ncbi:TniQ family protein [Mameliella alba]|uniref:TniQ family protein n=2 Tax=Mameliella alba TaxID=561184 RepID=UPI002FCD6A02
MRKDGQGVRRRNWRGHEQMLMLPKLPPFEEESTVSWCSRMARFHSNLSCAEWLQMMEISRQSVIHTTDECVRRLADLTGIPTVEIEACGIRPIGNRLFCHRAATFGVNFALRTHTTYCPACLLEDANAGNSSSGGRVGRVTWTFAPVRTCPQHRIALYRRRNRGFFEQFQDMNLVAPGNLDLEAQVAEAQSRTCSPLQSYVALRLQGAAEAEWLDGQSIDQASRTCEMLGACMVFGAHTNLGALSQNQWDEAGAAGFEAAAAGPSGIREALDEIAARSWQIKGTGGPQAAFGRLYQWLHADKGRKDPGPIRGVVRDHILDILAIEPGTKLFGKVIAKRHRHSVPSLARESGLHPVTLRRALVEIGLVPHDARTNNGCSFDAVEGAKLASRIQNSIPIKKIPAYLNCNRTQARMLVRSGVVKQLVPGEGKRGGLLSQVAKEDLDDLLRRLLGAAKPVSEGSHGMMNAIEASEIVRETVTDIVKLVLDGSLSRVEALHEDLRFRSILVDPDEVRRAITEKSAIAGFSAREVGDRLRIPASGINWLQKTLAPDGRPLLTSEKTINARGTTRHRFPEQAIAEFEARYASLAKLAEENGQFSQTVMRRLKRAGVEPILPRNQLRALVFRRAEL